MGLPAEPHLEFLPRTELAQKAQDCLAFVSRQPIDMGGELAIDVQRLALCHWMGANNRMRCLRVDLTAFGDTHQRVVPTIDVVARMRRCQPFEIDLHTSGKRIIGRILAGEERIYAAVRYRVEVENAAHRRLLVTGDIRVPIFPVDALGIGIGMDRQNLGMSFGPGRAGMNMQFTEISAESLVGFHIQRLVAKEQNLVLRKRLMQLLDLTIAEWLSQYDALDIGADARRNRRDADGSIGHGMTFDGGGADDEGAIDSICWLYNSRFQRYAMRATNSTCFMLSRDDAQRTQTLGDGRSVQLGAG